MKNNQEKKHLNFSSWCWSEQSKKYVGYENDKNISLNIGIWGK